MYLSKIAAILDRINKTTAKRGIERKFRPISVRSNKGQLPEGGGGGRAVY